MASKIQSKDGLVAFAQQLGAGTKKHFANATPLTFAGASHTPDEITSKLQSIVTGRNETESAKANARAKIASEEANLPALRAFLLAYAAFVRACFAGKPDVLAEFGIAPKARAQPTTAAKTAAVAKRAATRKARGTMGSKQKALVKGAVTGVVVTPVTAAAPVDSKSPTTAPAANAGGPGANAQRQS